jgi:hypothetical protein
MYPTYILYFSFFHDKYILFFNYITASYNHGIECLASGETNVKADIA